MAAFMRWVSERISDAGHEGLMNSWVSCRSRIRSRVATVSISSSGSAKRLTSGLVLSESVKAILKPCQDVGRSTGRMFFENAQCRARSDRRPRQGGAARGQRVEGEVGDYRQIVGGAPGRGI